jgi:hypothetical protein
VFPIYITSSFHCSSRMDAKKGEMKMNRQTLDLDWYFLHTLKLNPKTIIEKICHHCRKYVFSFECYPSCSLNGYHIIIWCKKQGCDLCRLLFDDQKRLQNDLSLRQPYERNVLFNQKQLIRNHKIRVTSFEV